MPMNMTWRGGEYMNFKPGVLSGLKLKISRSKALLEESKGAADCVTIRNVVAGCR